MILDMIGKFFSWIVRTLGGLTLIQMSLLALTLANVAWGLMVVVDRQSVGPLVMVAMVGMLTGWWIGRTRLRGYVSSLIGLAAGLIYLSLSVGRLGNPLLAFLRTISPLAGQILHCSIWPSIKRIIACGSPDFEPFITTSKVLSENTVTLVTRVLGWFKGVFSGILVVDPLVTPLLWGMALWFVAIWAGWWVRRRNSVLIGLLPATALIAYNVYYTNDVKGIFYLVLVAGGMVMLQAANGYLKSEKHWLSRRMDRVVIEPTLAATVFFLVGAFMLAGGLLPSVSINKITTTIQDILHPDQNRVLAESLGLQQTPLGAKPGMAGAGPVVVAAVHAIGAGPRLTQDVVMYVSVDGYNPLPPDIARITNEIEPPVAYYWRAQTYDRYNGHVWSTDTNQTVTLLPNGAYYPNLTDLPINYKQVVQHVQRAEPTGGILFYDGDLLSADQSTTADFRAPGDMIDAQTTASSYTAISRMQYVTVSQLRAASNDYPDYIHRHYLGLPDELPQRVRDLALDLTAGKVNGYDRAKAIETYLRTFTYTLDVPAPPSDRDVADYFLFDLKRGYCDYFASSMVVLARAAGLPTRLVTGYSSGNYDYNNHHFVVVAANAHSWAEIYFPGIGWVEFEPTTNLAAIPHPGEEDVPNRPVAAVPSAPQETAPTTFKINWSTFRTPLQILGTSLAVLAILFFLLPVKTWLLYLRPANQAIPTIYNRLYRRGYVWGVEADATRTPVEFSAALITRLEKFKGDKKLSRLANAMLSDINWLTAIYNQLLFSPAPITPLERRQAVKTWGRLSRGLSRLQRW
jgi:transglutaminase-like putative cysteine protease